MRLIDADELEKTLENSCDTDSMARAFVEFLNYVDDTPTVDAVPVVRCENCIHWVTDDLGNRVCGIFDLANSNGEPVATKPDDFCSYGKRRVGD